MTTREESWGAYLSETFDVGHQPPIFYSPQSFTVPYTSPGNSNLDRTSFFPDVLSYLHSWEKHPARIRCADMKTDFWIDLKIVCERSVGV